MRVFSFTEAGGHVENEDAFLIQPHPREPALLLCVLADGQGGTTGGGLAARLACRTCIDLAGACSPADLTQPASWIQLLRRTDLAVSGHEGAGLTTLVAFALLERALDGKLCGASCGDSAAVAVAGDHPPQVLTAGQRKNPPVGSGAAAVTAFAADLEHPWSVLVMSDGVWKYAGWPGVLAAARHGQEDDVLADLQKRARLPGSGQFQDDFTLVVIQPEAEQNRTDEGK
jgi:hypothetical protein